MPSSFSDVAASNVTDSTVADTTSSAVDTSELAPLPSRNDRLRQYAEQDARLGSPNPRYKQCKLYCDRYLDVRVSLVGIEGLTDTDWDLTIF